MVKSIFVVEIVVQPSTNRGYLISFESERINLGIFESGRINLGVFENGWRF